MKNNLNILKYILFLLSQFIYHKAEYVIYRLESPKSDKYQRDSDVTLFENYDLIPKYIKDIVFRFRFLNVLYYRIKCKKAKLLCLMIGDQIISYGWLQKWQPFKKKFGWISEDASMLGPFWTDSNYRGKGYYGRILSHSIAIADKKKPIIIYTSPQNQSSQRGIEKSGFNKVGVFQILFLFRFIKFKKKVS